MKISRKFTGTVITVFIFLSACSSLPGKEQAGYTGEVYLYGEAHGVEKILEEELRLWNDYYHYKNMRHLFIETAYYTAELLNIWMRSDDDSILDAIYDDWEGTAFHNRYYLAFYKRIKDECPDTIFHGTDVGHNYNTAGKRYLRYLEKNNMRDSLQYELAGEAIKQGRRYSVSRDGVFRENRMTENFIRELMTLDVGRRHGNLRFGAYRAKRPLNYAGSVPSMANQLNARYGSQIHSADLSYLARDISPLRTGTITIGETDYSASYFGKEDLLGFRDYVCREIWRLEDAYDSFKDMPKTGDFLPCDSYPMIVKAGEVFVIDYVKTDDSVIRFYYRSDGNSWQGQPATEGFTAAQGR